MTERVFPRIQGALDLLRVRPPKARRGMTQRDVDCMLAAWKENDLARALQARRMEMHPDHGGTADEFARLTTAANEIREHLKLRVPESAVTVCPACGYPRAAGGHFCGACGTRYASTESLTACPACNTARTGGRFCTHCGFEFERDALELLLLARGLTETRLRKMKLDGTLELFRGTSPASPKFGALLNLYGK